MPLRQSSVDEYQAAVDEHPFHALGKLVRLRVGRAVAPPGQFKNDEVGHGARANRAAVADAKDRGRQARHRVHCLFEGEHIFFDDGAADFPREGGRSDGVIPLMAMSAARDRRARRRDAPSAMSSRSNDTAQPPWFAASGRWRPSLRRLLARLPRPPNTCGLL